MLRHPDKNHISVIFVCLQLYKGAPLLVDFKGVFLEFVNTFGSSVNFILSWLVSEQFLSIVTNNAFAVCVVIAIKCTLCAQLNKTILDNLTACLTKSLEH